MVDGMIDPKRQTLRKKLVSVELPQIFQCLGVGIKLHRDLLKVVAAAMFLRLRRFDWNPFLSAPQLPGKRVLPVSVTRLFCFEPRSRIGDKDRGNEKDAR